MNRCCFVIAVFLAACGGPGPSGTDLPDAAGTDGGGEGPHDGGAAQLDCAHVRVMPQYPWGVTVGTFVASQRMTFGILASNSASASSRLVVEVWPAAGGAEPAVPLAHTFSTADRYASCENCVLIGEGCTTQPNQCRTYYFAQAGTLRILEAGRAEAGGRLRATGSNLTFAEWSIAADAPVPNGRCLQVTNLDMDAEWGEGGACSGDACGSGGACCGDSPYCSLGNNSIGRFCSDYCGESGDGCTGNQDCCDGYSCFLGTCIVESCGNDTCTTGLDEGGGCCDRAAYCVEGRCTGTCGVAGQGCGGDLDCCSGLGCAGGTCQ